MTTFEAAISQSARLAALDELLPAAGTPRHGWLARFSRRPRGLEAIPERYRLQFLVFAREAMPGRPAAEVRAAADRLADGTRIPARLLAKLPEHSPLDAWFRSRTDEIQARLDDLIRGAS